jgi:coenzyme F420-reducing hydrogenase delta subunit
VNAIKDILQESGIERERLRMVNISAAMATNLAAVINEMVSTIKELGPNPLRKTTTGPEIEFKEFEALNSQQ